VKAMFSTYGRKRLGVEKNFVVKLNSWHMFNSLVFSKAYGNIPWLCIYRHPIEIIMGRIKRDLRSNYSWVDYGVGLSIPSAEKIKMDMIDLMSKNLGCMYRHIRKNFLHRDNSLCINYEDFSDDLYKDVLNHFSLSVSSEEFAKMFSVSQYHSKSDSKEKKKFVSDSIERRKSASIEIIRSVEKYALEEYEKLQEEGFLLSGK
jgi:hypothetical protein